LGGEIVEALLHALLEKIGDGGRRREFEASIAP
jgi:hypothetical protein